MNRSKKYSYFAGKTAKLSDDPILYERYVAPSSVGTAPQVEDKPKDSEKKVKSKKRDPPSQERGDAVVKKVRKKERWSEEKKAAVRAEKEEAKKNAPEGHEDAGKKSAKKKKKKKKKSKKDGDESDKEEEVPLRKLTAEERVSGPSNAEEAQVLRGTLGFVDTTASTKGKNASSFEFGFGSQIEVEPVKEDEEEEDAQSEEELEKEAEEASSSDTSSSSSSSSDDSDGDEEYLDNTTTNNNNDNATVAPVQQEQQQEEEEEVDADGFIPRRIFVGGMPFGYTEDMVREYWEYCGPIEALDVMVFPDTGRFKGIAFITFATQEAYQSALSFDGTDCDGQILKVQKCKADAKKRYKKQPDSVDGRNEATGNNIHRAEAPTPAGGTQHRPPAQKVQGYNVAYVGNIAFEASPDDIKTLFEPYGVTVVRLHTDKDTGKPKGYAHVHFKDEESLDKAMALNGTPILGRKIRVGYAQLKKNAS